MTSRAAQQADGTSSEQPAPQEHPLLGKSEFVFEVAPRKQRAPRSIVLLGMVSVIMVPVGLTWVKGGLGTTVAVLGGLVALFCYLLSGSKTRGSLLRIEVFERGIAATQADASRAILWNQIVDATCHTIPMPNGRFSTAIVFEVVGEPPLLVMVGTPVGDKDRSLGLIKALSSAWLAVWSRRACVLLETDHELKVGQAHLTRRGLQLGERKLAWSEIEGVDRAESRERLLIEGAALEVEDPSSNVQFPSAAQRLLAVARSAPSLPLLPES